MPRKIESVKISVEDKTPKKKAAPKKRVATSASSARSKKKTVTKKQVKLEPVVPQKIDSGNQFASLLISIIITALVVGGGISVIQKLISSKDVTDAKNETENVKSEFQSKLDELKNKLQGKESENEEVKAEKEKLASIVSKAKAEYVNEDLGISFFYPASFGDVMIAYEDGETGQKFSGIFSDFDKLIFGGVTTDYNISGELMLTDTQGYQVRGGTYYYKSIGEEPEVYEFEAFKFLEIDENEIPVIDKEDFLNSEKEIEEMDEELSFDEIMGESDDVEVMQEEEKNKLLALVNLEGEKYLGLAFWNKSTADLPLDDFENILKSIEISEPVVEEEVEE